MSGATTGATTGGGTSAGSSTLLFHHHDHLGSTVALTSSTGSLVEAYRYSAWGVPEVWKEGSTTVTNSGTVYQVSKWSALNKPPRTELLYTGRPYSYKTKLSDLRARVYSPYQSRFLQRDPIGYGDGMNVYLYVGNSPLMYVDRDGMKAKSILGEGIEYVGGAALDALDAIDWRNVQNNVGSGLQTTGLVVAWVSGPACLASVKITWVCGVVSIASAWLTLPVCTITAASAWASCGVAGAGLWAAALGTWMKNGTWEGTGWPDGSWSKVRKPENAENSELKRIINELYRDGAVIWNTSTADAIRHELRTGERVWGKLHSKKWQDQINALEKLIKGWQLSDRDRWIVNALIRDTKSALDGN